MATERPGGRRAYREPSVALVGLERGLVHIDVYRLLEICVFGYKAVGLLAVDILGEFHQVMVRLDSVWILGCSLPEEVYPLVVAVKYGDCPVADADPRAESVLRDRKLLGERREFGIFGGGVFEIEHLIFPVGQSGVELETGDFPISGMVAFTRYDAPVRGFQLQGEITVGETFHLRAECEMAGRADIVVNGFPLRGLLLWQVITAGCKQAGHDDEWRK